MDLIPVHEDSGDSDGERTVILSESAVKLAEIATTPVVRMKPTAEIRMVGLVDYDETKLSSINAYLPGRLERLFVDYTGIRVRKGDHLVEIYSPELLAAQEELLQAVELAERAKTEDNEYLLGSTTSMIEAVREKLRLWGLTETQIQDIEITKQVSDIITIYAPLGGIVIEMNAVEGMYVKTGTTIYKLADLDHLWVKLDAYETDLNWLRYGQEVQFTTTAHAGETFTGRITFIDPVLSSKTRTVKVRVHVDNTDHRLKPGMFVQALVRPIIGGNGIPAEDNLTGKWMCPMHPEEIADEPEACGSCGMDLVPVEELGYNNHNDPQEPDPLVIPISAALITGKRAVVYVRVPDQERPTFEGRIVTLGPRADDYYIVRSGLEEDEEAVTNGAFKIDSALQITAKPSMMSPSDDEDINGEETADSSEEVLETKQIEVPTEFLTSLKPLYDTYFVLWEALADDDYERFAAGLPNMAESIKNTTTNNLSSTAKNEWNPISTEIKTLAKRAGEAKDIESARALFESYSKLIIQAAETFGSDGERSLYVTYCPMAFDFKGASWLQTVEQVTNPYFGDMMLRCGETRKTIGPANDHTQHDHSEGDSSDDH